MTLIELKQAVDAALEKNHPLTRVLVGKIPCDGICALTAYGDPVQSAAMSHTGGVAFVIGK